MYLTGFLKERLICYGFFAQLKWSGRVYTLTAVSGLKDAVTFSKVKVAPVVLHGKGSSIGHSKRWLGWQNKDLL